MGNSKDIKALVESNINYEGVISKFINPKQYQVIYTWSQPINLLLCPMRVIEFENLVENKVYKDLKIPKQV